MPTRTTATAAETATICRVCTGSEVVGPFPTANSSTLLSVEVGTLAQTETPAVLLSPVAVLQAAPE